MFEQVMGIAVFIGAFGVACGMIYKTLMYLITEAISKARVEQEKQTQLFTQEMLSNIIKEFDKLEVNLGSRLTDIEKNQLLTFSKIAQHDEELKYLNRVTKAIKSDAEIREIVKRD